MKWQGRRTSGNVLDKRGGTGGLGGGLGGSLGRSGRSGGTRSGPMIGGGAGIGGIIVVLLLSLFGGGFGGLGGIFGGGEGGNNGAINLPDYGGRGGMGGGGGIPIVEDDTEESRREFLSVVLADTEDAWTEIFAQYDMVYEPATLVIYRDSTQTACGAGSAQAGPFYCPADKRVYMDLSFFDQLSDDYGADGDFAMAYVLAHEVGHHVQTLLGISEQVSRYRSSGRIDQKLSNELTRRMELQADYLAGVWANYMGDEGYLERGDIREAMDAAAAVGADRMQKEARGYAVPDSFTHGTSDQRMRWFMKGYETGDFSEWDTFDQATPVDELRHDRAIVLMAA